MLGTTTSAVRRWHAAQGRARAQALPPGGEGVQAHPRQGAQQGPAQRQWQPTRHAPGVAGDRGGLRRSGPRP
eukprot:4139019-Alexandrium_andersonii.AAC.2